LVFSIASSEKKILPNKIVSLYLIFFSKIVYRYCFNRYIFEYRCPPLYNGRDWIGSKAMSCYCPFQRTLIHRQEIRLCLPALK
jgi:hypothetical protein